ncbi:hypothetical protein [Vampirovibrio chlorellavorus]|uniref:hypothetical protein n=1 Tax=Vampirovibrio chlorellavorus TaxID=758823 RepID=UPI0026F3144C|nr:hypothetical protein [Vampirovibrio chlorellavorus]
MAVLFPTPFGYTLKANKPAELLQGFLNIQAVENVSNGQLTKANLDSYSTKNFLAADPSSNIAGYLRTNFAAIAKLDGNANGISVDDLVQLRNGLPTSPPVTNPPVTQPPVNNINQILLLLFAQMLQLFLGRNMGASL